MDYTVNFIKSYFFNNFNPFNPTQYYDRNKKILATTIKTLSLNINPQEILNKNETIIKLLQIFSDLNEKSLLKKLNSDKRHINLLREISPREYVRLLQTGIEGLKIQMVKELPV